MQLTTNHKTNENEIQFRLLIYVQFGRYLRAFAALFSGAAKELLDTGECAIDWINTDVEPRSASRQPAWSAVHVAARNGFADVVELLVERGAAVGRADLNNFSPMALAALGGHAKCIKVLREVRS
jgi:hypothetical protein